MLWVDQERPDLDSSYQEEESKASKKKSLKQQTKPASSIKSSKFIAEKQKAKSDISQTNKHVQDMPECEDSTEPCTQDKIT